MSIADEDHEQPNEPDPTDCPICNGPGRELGRLGILRWFRCRDCGMDYNKEFNQPTRTPHTK